MSAEITLGRTAHRGPGKPERAASYRSGQRCGKPTATRIAAIPNAQ